MFHWVLRKILFFKWQRCVLWCSCYRLNICQSKQNFSVSGRNLHFDCFRFRKCATKNYGKDIPTEGKRSLKRIITTLMKGCCFMVRYWNAPYEFITVNSVLLEGFYWLIPSKFSQWKWVLDFAWVVNEQVFVCITMGTYHALHLSEISISLSLPKGGFKDLSENILAIMSGGWRACLLLG